MIYIHIFMCVYIYIYSHLLIDLSPLPFLLDESYCFVFFFNFILFLNFTKLY